MKKRMPSTRRRVQKKTMPNRKHEDLHFRKVKTNDYKRRHQVAEINKKREESKKIQLNERKKIERKKNRKKRVALEPSGQKRKKYGDIFEEKSTKRIRNSYRVDPPHAQISTVKNPKPINPIEKRKKTKVPTNLSKKATKKNEKPQESTQLTIHKSEQVIVSKPKVSPHTVKKKDEIANVEKYPKKEVESNNDILVVHKQPTTTDKVSTIIPEPKKKSKTNDLEKSSKNQKPLENIDDGAFDFGDTQHITDNTHNPHKFARFPSVDNSLTTPHVGPVILNNTITTTHEVQQYDSRTVNSKGRTNDLDGLATQQDGVDLGLNVSYMQSITIKAQK